MTTAFLDEVSQEQFEEGLKGGDNRYVQVSKIEGEKRLRFIGAAKTGLEGWIVGEGDEKDKPIRFEKRPEELPEDLRTDDKGKPQLKHFLAGVVWDYDSQSLMILSMTQKTLREQLFKFIRDEDYGDPQGYDIKISREGEGLNTKYGLLASPPKPVSKEIKEAWDTEGVKINLQALFDNEDPFADCA